MRALFDEAGKPVDEAGPSMPVVVLGLSGAPNAGDELLVVESERKAREVAMHRQGKSRDVKLAQKSANMQDVFSHHGRDQGRRGRSCWSRRTCRAAPRRCAMR